MIHRKGTTTFSIINVSKILKLELSMTISTQVILYAPPQPQQGNQIKKESQKEILEDNKNQWLRIKQTV